MTNLLFPNNKKKEQIQFLSQHKFHTIILIMLEWKHGWNYCNLSVWQHILKFQIVLNLNIKLLTVSKDSERKINVDNFLGSSIVVEDNDMKIKEESLKTISSPLVGISAENI